MHFDALYLDQVNDTIECLQAMKKTAFEIQVSPLLPLLEQALDLMLKLKAIVSEDHKLLAARNSGIREDVDNRDELGNPKMIKINFENPVQLPNPELAQSFFQIALWLGDLIRGFYSKFNTLEWKSDWDLIKEIRSDSKKPLLIKPKVPKDPVKRKSVKNYYKRRSRKK